MNSVERLALLTVAFVILSTYGADAGPKASSAPSGHYVSGAGIAPPPPPPAPPPRQSYVSGGGVTFTPNQPQTPIPSQPAYVSGGGISFTPIPQPAPPPIDSTPHYATGGGIIFTPNTQPTPPPIDATPHYATGGGIVFTPAPTQTPPAADTTPHYASGGGVSFTPSPTLAPAPVDSTPHYATSGGISFTPTPTQAPAAIDPAPHYATGGAVSSGGGSSEVSPQPAYVGGGSVSDSPAGSATAPQTFYIQSGTGTALTAEQIRTGSFPAGTFFVQSGSGRPVTQTAVQAGFQQTSTTSSQPAPTLTQVLSSAQDQQFVSSLSAVQRQTLNQYTPQQIQSLQQSGQWQIVKDTILGLPTATKDVLTGFAVGAGTASKDIAAGTATSLLHPVQTAQELASAVSHPAATADNVATSLRNTAGAYATAIQQGNGQAAGQIIGKTFVNAVATVASGSEATNAARLVDDASQSARVAEQAANLSNYDRGLLGASLTRAKYGDAIAGEQVTFQTSTGATAVPDFVLKDGTIVETKTGGATLSDGQQQLFADIAAGRPVTPVGANAEKAGLKPGVPIVLPKATIDRPF